MVWKSSCGWQRGGSKGKPCSCGTPQALHVGQLRELSGPSLFSPINNKNNDTKHSIHFSQVWIKINWTPELLLSRPCILCSPSAKLSYRLNFHSLLQNEPFKVISYSFSFPPQNMETPIRGEGRGSSVSFAAGHVVHSADWVMLCSLPDVCNYAHKGNRPPRNTQAQGPSLYHFPPNYGVSISLPEQACAHLIKCPVLKERPDETEPFFNRLGYFFGTFPSPVINCISLRIKQ